MAARKAPAKRAAPRKAAPKKAAPKKAAPKKATPKKATPKKATPKKAAADIAAKKNAGTKAATSKSPVKKAPAKQAPAKQARFGRPGTAGKAEGDAAVREWLGDVKAEHRAMLERLDALLREEVPDVKTAIKWSMPMYGREGIGYFAHLASFKNYVTIGFFSGTSLSPQPPYGESDSMRRVNLHGPADFDEALLRSWIRQASVIPGWSKV